MDFVLRADILKAVLFMNNSAADAHSPGMPFPARSITIRNGRRSSLSKEAEATAPSSHHRPLCRAWWCSFCNCCLSHPESSIHVHSPTPVCTSPVTPPFTSTPEKLGASALMFDTDLPVSAILAAKAAIQGQHQRVRHVDSIGSPRPHMPTRRRVYER
ncbi:hypothetical protein BC826DRAFT_1025433 [Russula brevipes]|nr:hypothetical protein BC826DRAFT_1025433 [Russula brevipes]